MHNLTKLNHFEKFSFTPTMEIDLDILEERYLILQQQYHPDVLYNKSEEEQNMAVANSIAANQAYQILQNPVKRAIYLLKINGIDIDDDHCPIKPDHQDLTEILEMRERFAFSVDPKEIDLIKAEIEKKIKILMLDAASCFVCHDFENMALRIIKVKYFDKICEDIRIKKQKTSI